jgi:hypothetical protein
MRRPELRLIQSTIESVLSPALADQTYRDAITALGGEPATSSDVLELVNGPLRVSLARRLGRAAADDVVDDLLATLVTTAPPRPASAEATRELPLEREQVCVLVLSSTDALARALAAELGPRRLEVATAGTPEEARAWLATHAAGIVMIDGASFASIEPTSLPALLAPLPTTTVRAVWAVDAPYGAAALGALVEAHAPVTPLDRREGLATVVDLVRARRYTG